MIRVYVEYAKSNKKINKEFNSFDQFQIFFNSLNRKDRIKFEDGNFSKKNVFPIQKVKELFLKEGSSSTPSKDQNGALHLTDSKTTRNSLEESINVDSKISIQELSREQGRSPTQNDYATQIDSIRKTLDVISDKIKNNIDPKLETLDSELRTKLHRDIEVLNASIVELQASLTDDKLIGLLNHPLEKWFSMKNQILEEKTSSVSTIADSMATKELAIDSKIKQLLEDKAELEFTADQRREILIKYKPGYFDVLNQQYEQNKKLLEEKNADSLAKQMKIDELERTITLMKIGSGAYDLEEINKKISVLNEKLSQERNLAELQSENEALRFRVKHLEGFESLYNKQQEEFKVDINARNHLKELEISFQELDQRCKEIVSDKEAHERRIRYLTSSLATHKENIEQLRKEKNSLEDEKITLAAQLNEAQNSLSLFKLHEDQINKAGEDLRQRKIEQENSLREEEAKIKIYAEDLENSIRQNMMKDQELKEANLSAKYEEKYAEKINANEREIQRLTRQRELFKNENDSLKIENAKCWETKLDWEAREARCNRELEVLESQRDESKKAVDELVKNITSKRLELASINKEYADLAAEKTRQLTLNEDEQKKRIRDDISKLKEDKISLEGHVKALKSDEKDMYDRIKELKEMYKSLELKHVDKDSRVRSIHEPFDPEVSERKRAGRINELEWLETIKTKISQAEFSFPDRLVYAFHTSLKIAEWAPLIVLSGVSGTGKSELPRLYSMFGGIQFLLVSVQPNWDSPQDLFGFFNYLDGRYKATQLLQAIVQSQKPVADNGFEDSLLLVLLDEMNLARIELYFSELLSKMEQRRGRDIKKNDSQTSISIDLGAGVTPEMIYIGKNIFYTGTINEDETTQTLSDKVIDRGNIISFPRPEKLKSREIKNLDSFKKEELLTYDTWRSWLKPHDFLDEEVRGEIRTNLDRINQNMALVNRAIGHRVLQAIEAYVTNHPLVAKDKKKYWKIAFADQIVQKVMPKLRGIEVESSTGKDCLDGIRNILDMFEENEEKLIQDFDHARKTTDGSFLWTSADYLNQKLPE